MHPDTSNLTVVACVLNLPLIPSFGTVICFLSQSLLCPVCVIISELVSQELHICNY